MKVSIALQVAKALEHCHAMKIVHRDIKPENIHLDPSGRARLMDFGIAKAEGLSMTKTGLALGYTLLHVAGAGAGAARYGTGGRVCVRHPAV